MCVSDTVIVGSKPTPGKAVQLCSGFCVVVSQVQPSRGTASSPKNPNEYL